MLADGGYGEAGSLVIDGKIDGCGCDGPALHVGLPVSSDAGSFVGVVDVDVGENASLGLLVVGGIVCVLDVGLLFDEVVGVWFDLLALLDVDETGLLIS